MLRKDELATIAETKRLSLTNAERDYLLEALLFALYTNIKNELVFKGGTALYKLHSLNRFSEDLDFTLMKHRRTIRPLLERALRQLSLLGISARIKEITEYRKEINVRIECRGPLYNGSKESLVFIPLNISLREKVQYAAYELLFSSYRELPSFEVYAMDAREIAAEKVRAILNRDKARDVYDLWFLLKKGIELEKALVEKKLKINKLSFNMKDLSDAIAAKEKMWEIDLRKLVLGNIPDFQKIRQDILILLEKQKGL